MESDTSVPVEATEENLSTEASDDSLAGKSGEGCKKTSCANEPCETPCSGQAGPIVPDRVEHSSTFTLEVTQAELAHIRDLMSVLLPPTGELTLGQSIGLQEGRPYVDSVLFRKVYQACEEAGVPTGQAAPDFGLSLASVPQITVTRVTTSLLEADASEAA